MKTTIDLNDGLLHEAKRLAGERGVTLRTVLETALRRELDASTTLDFKFTPVEFEGRGVQPGIDLSDWQRIADMAYEGRGGTP